MMRIHHIGKGFTLIELMVSVAIFSVVMVLALGSLLSISTSEKKAETLKSVMNNLNFALDSMSRSIRTGSVYHCGSSGTLTVAQDCTNPGQSYLAFKATDGITTVVYWLDTTANECGQTGAVGGCIMRCFTTNGTCNPPGSGTPNSFSQITAPEVIIAIAPGQPGAGAAGLIFYVTGSCDPAGTGGCTPDTVEPKVTMTLSGYTQVTATQQTAFNIQTSVTERLYDQ